MNFLKGRIYRHKKFMDVAVIVNDTMPTTDGGYRLKITWIAAADKRIIGNDTIVIKPKLLSSWEEVRG